VKAYIVAAWLCFLHGTVAWADKLVPVEQFVQQAFPHGVPIIEARKYGLADSARLLGLLKLQDNLEVHSNILETIGHIGDPVATRRVIDYIHRGQGEISAAAFRAKSNAFLCLGYMVNKTGNPVALNYLVNSLELETWQARKLQWRVAFLPDDVSRDLQLIRQAAIGLTLSGHPQAASAMKQRLSPSNDDNDFAAASSDMLQQMLRANQAISSQGLQAYMLDAQE